MRGKIKDRRRTNEVTTKSLGIPKHVIKLLRRSKKTQSSEQRPEVLLRTTPLAAAGLKSRIGAVGCRGHGDGGGGVQGGSGGVQGGGAGLQVRGREAQALPSKQRMPVTCFAWQRDVKFTL